MNKTEQLERMVEALRDVETHAGVTPWCYRVRVGSDSLTGAGYETPWAAIADGVEVAMQHDALATLTVGRGGEYVEALPMEYVDGRWICGDEATSLTDPDAVIVYTQTESPETGHVGWCWWALGAMGDAATLAEAMRAAERAAAERTAKR